jgi:secreted PhoX family phosphatase
VDSPPALDAHPPEQAGGARRGGARGARGAIDRKGNTRFPRRNGIAGETVDGGSFVVTTLILSVQHPSEDSPIGKQNPLERDIEILALNGGSVFSQHRVVPIGSTWPASIPVADGGQGNPAGLPKPATIGIRRRSGRAPWGDDDD